MAPVRSRQHLAPSRAPDRPAVPQFFGTWPAYRFCFRQMPGPTHARTGELPIRAVSSPIRASQSTDGSLTPPTLAAAAAPAARLKARAAASPQTHERARQVRSQRQEWCV
jgi:hypothetical protein